MPQDDAVQPPSLPDVLKRLRGEVPQHVLAAQIGVSPGLIGHAEKGTRSIGADKVDRIAKALGLTKAQHAELRAARDRQSALLSSKRRGPGDPEWAPLEMAEGAISRLDAAEAVARAQARATLVMGRAMLSRLGAVEDLDARLSELEQALAAQQAH